MSDGSPVGCPDPGPAAQELPGQGGAPAPLGADPALCSPLQGALHCTPCDPAPLQILDNTPESHVDHSSLKLALEQAEELCSQVNEGVREKENSDRLEWIQAHVQCDGLAEVRSRGCRGWTAVSVQPPSPLFRWGSGCFLWGTGCHYSSLRFDSKRGPTLRWTVPGSPRRFHAGWVCR